MGFEAQTPGWMRLRWRQHGTFERVSGRRDYSDARRASNNASHIGLLSFGTHFTLTNMTKNGAVNRVADAELRRKPWGFFF